MTNLISSNHLPTYYLPTNLPAYLSIYLLPTWNLPIMYLPFTYLPITNLQPTHANNLQPSYLHA